MMSAMTFMGDWGDGDLSGGCATPGRHAGQQRAETRDMQPGASRNFHFD
jgi:hypothetical protein